MPFVPFDTVEPELARKETRTLTVLKDLDGLPPSQYGFFEMYCDETDCDCRRVFINVFSTAHNSIVAVISYGWESRKFYSDWMGGIGGKAMVDSMKGPELDIAGRQSEFAPMLLKQFEALFLTDPSYVDRLKRHYAIFRAHIDRQAISTELPTNDRVSRRNKKRRRLRQGLAK